MTLAASFEAAMQQGLQASRTDDASAAVHAWAQAAALDPSSALPHMLIGAELAEAHQWAEAEDAYARAVTLAPRFQAARFQLGLLQFTMGRPSVAGVTWEPLRQLDTDNPFRFFAQAFAAEGGGDLVVAAALLERGMAANTDNPPLNRDMARRLAAIREQLSPRRAPRSSSPDHSDDQSRAEAHVLLAAYQQQGLSH